MTDYKAAFIEFMVRCDVLSFGDFTTKAGRKTPYFINAGRYRSGAQVSRLARFYADTIRARGIGFDVLFGPAYKGIPLCVATAMALSDDHGIDVGFCFNRKEVKDHGEGGILVGHDLKDGDRVLIIEDVTSAGTSIRETVPLMRAAANVTLAGLVVSVDRMERGTGEQNTLAQIRQEFEMDTFAITTIDEIIEHLHGREIDGQVYLTDELRGRMLDYLSEYRGK